MWWSTCRSASFSAADYAKASAADRRRLQGRRAEPRRPAALRPRRRRLEGLPGRAREPPPPAARHPAPGPRGRRVRRRSRAPSRGSRRHEAPPGPAHLARQNSRRPQAHPVQRRNQRHLGDLRTRARLRRAAHTAGPSNPGATCSRHRHPGPPQQGSHRPALSPHRRRTGRRQPPTSPAANATSAWSIRTWAASAPNSAPTPASAT
jgi:hypothetical protein